MSHVQSLKPVDAPQTRALAREWKPARALFPTGCLITFHRAATSESWAGQPNRDFYVDIGFLDRLLQSLKRSGWDIVTVDEAVRRTRDGHRSRYVNFSIDDAYRDTAELVAPLFASHGCPLTVYVTTGIPDETCCLWLTGLETVLLESREVRLPDGPVDVSTPALKRSVFGKLAAAWEQAGPELEYERFCRLNGYDPLALHRRNGISWDMLKAMRLDPLIEIGAHTIQHPRISSLSENAAWNEIWGCRERLMHRLDCPVRHFAFPYGRRNDRTTRDFALARDAGFDSAATTSKGVLRGRDPDLFALPRNTLNGSTQTLALVQAHLFGLSGAAARLMGRL